MRLKFNNRYSMLHAKRLLAIVAVALGASSAVAAQEPAAQADSLNGAAKPQRWDLQGCIDYALQQNLTIRRNRISEEISQIDVKTAKAALFPNLSFSTGQNMVNRPYQETSSTVSGTEILRNSSKTSYNANYGLNASWTIYNGSKRLKTIEQEKLNNQIAELDVEASANSVQESIAQIYVQILYAAESVKINEGTVQLSKAQRDRGKELLDAGSISKSEFAQLEAQVSSDQYQLVVAQSTLQDYKLQLKQLLELSGEEEMDVYTPVLSDDKVLVPLPNKNDVYLAALAIRPEIKASQLSVEASETSIAIAKSGYLPSVSLSAGIGTTHTSGSDFTFGEQVKNGWNNSIGLSISVPIFNNRQTKSAVQQAKLQHETSQLTLLEDQKTLYKTIEGLWLDANNAQQQYAAAKEKLQSARVSYELVCAQFDESMVNTVELLTEKNNLMQAQQEHLQAKYMAILNAQLLKFYQGERLEL